MVRGMAPCSNTKNPKVPFDSKGFTHTHTTKSFGWSTQTSRWPNSSLRPQLRILFPLFPGMTVRWLSTGETRSMSPDQNKSGDSAGSHLLVCSCWIPLETVGDLPMIKVDLPMTVEGKSTTQSDWGEISGVPPISPIPSVGTELLLEPKNRTRVEPGHPKKGKANIS